MTDAATIADRYIAVWNETNPERRRTVLAELWTETGTYMDPLIQGESHDQIDALIAGVHGQFSGFRIALTGQPDGYASHVRFSWELGPEGGESLVKGTDFGNLENGRLRSIVGLLDQVPSLL